MDVRFEWDKDWEKKVIAEARKAVRKKAQEALSEMRCPDHGDPIRFISESGSGQSLGRIEACCEKAVKLGEEALARVLK